MEPGISRDDSLLTAAAKQFGDLTTDSQTGGAAMDDSLVLTESQDAEAATEALASVDVCALLQ